VIGGGAPRKAMDHPSYLTSAPIDISQGPSPVYLEFYRWLNSDVSSVMTNSVEVFNGSQWVTLWSGPLPGAGLISDNAWSRQYFNITAYRNPDFRVRFGYQIGNTVELPVGSWNIDDIRISNTLSCATE